MRRGVMLRRWPMFACVAISSLLTLHSSPLEAQRRSRMRDMAAMLGGSDYWTPPMFKGNVPYDGRFTFARIMYRGAGCWNQQGPGWSHDYPDAESHLVQILRELTSMRPNMTSSNIVSLEDPDLFKHPVAYLSEPGCWEMSDKEVAGLRAYLKKGGFLIFDDFGDYGRQELMNTEQQLRRAIPGAQIVKLDATHPIFDAFFHIKSLDIIDQTYRGIPEYWGVFQDNDPKKRLIAILNVNNDIGENWEYSNTGLVPIPISNESYKLGVNYMVYALTH
jgi:hypothetical protein